MLDESLNQTTSSNIIWHFFVFQSHPTSTTNASNMLDDVEPTCWVRFPGPLLAVTSHLLCDE